MRSDVSDEIRLIFVAPANSLHSFKWIDYFGRHMSKVEWHSLYQTNAAFSETYRSVTPQTNATIRSRLLKFVVTWLYLQRNIAREKGTRTIVHGHTAGIHGLLAMFLTGVQKRILTVWGSDILIIGKQLKYRWLVRKLLARADIITCDADHMVTELQKFGVPRNKIRIIYFGVETTKLVPQKATAAERQKVTGNATTSIPVIISLRNHYPVYDIGTLIKACKKLKETHEFHLVIAGSGPETKALEALSATLGLEQNITFFGKYTARDIPLLLSCATLYVSTSLSDAGIASSTAEAMSCGVPVIVSNTGENSLWIQHDVTGWIFEPSDSSELANQIATALSQPAKLHEVGMRGRQVIAQRNDYETEMKKMHEDIVALA